MDIEAIKRGEGPVAEQLRLRDHLHMLNNNWRLSMNIVDNHLGVPMPQPCAEELIRFCAPWQATKHDTGLTEDELLEMVAPFFCFVKRHSGFGLSREKRSREFIALKAEPKLTEVSVMRAGVRAKYSKPELSITIEEPSGSSATIKIDPARFAQSHGWYTVEIFNVLEKVTYPGQLSDVYRDMFQTRLLELMKAASWDDGKWVDNQWVQASKLGILYERFGVEHQDIVKKSAPFRMPKTGYAFEYLIQQFHREGCAYAEYVEAGEVRWVFVSKFYDTGGQSRFFHGKVGDPQIEVLKLHIDHFGDYPKEVWNISQNMNNSLAQFDPMAFDQFFRLFTLGRQIFVSHQSDD